MLTKLLSLLLCFLSIWVIKHLWAERTCSDRYFSDQKAVETYYQNTIWRLKNLAKESISTVALLHSQQLQIEAMSQDIKLIKSPNSQDILKRRKQDCYTCGGASPPTEYNSEYTPYLFASNMDMTPLRRVGLGKSGYKLVFGIPTVQRGEDYLLHTLSSLLDPAGIPERRGTLFIVFVAEIMNFSYCQRIIDDIESRYDKELSNGVLEVICPNPSSYPPLGHLPQTLSDPEDRLNWRAKQVVDFSFLMSYAASKGEYYIQLEDDVIGARGYIQHIQGYIDSHSEEPWLFINFSLLGFIGKLFRTQDLTPFIHYILLFYYRQPVDWLLASYQKDIYCYYSQSEYECQSVIASSAPLFVPSLFQHIGTTSSLKGKVQELTDTGFTNFIASSNPPAYLSAVMKTHESNLLSKVYLKQGYFWAMDVQLFDYVVISLLEPQELLSIQVVTGGEAGRNDILVSGQVEYCTDEAEDFYFMCIFVNGKADCKFPELTLIASIRILVTKAQAQWLIISELKLNTL